MTERRTSVVRGGYIPTPLNSFIGREVELDEAATLLTESRLITLVGVAGVGKTRLAIELSTRVRRSFPGGVWFVDLASVSNEGLIGHTISTVLGLASESATDIASSIAGFLSKRRALLVLDNCEHLADACARFSHLLLSRCSHLRVLATSRTSLEVTGEVVFTVEPLSTTLLASDRGPGGPGLPPALRLFFERARAAYPSLPADASNLRLIGEICERLDGLPLAIELAAPWVRTLGLPELADHLREPLQLVGDQVVAGNRHRSLRSAIEWSVGLLEPRAQLLWQRLSVFAGSFDLDAVTAVCVDDDLGHKHVVSLLASLIGASLLLPQDEAGRHRYRMLATVRACAAESLDAAEDGDLFREKHKVWYLGLACATEKVWSTPRQVEWLNRLELELDNIRSALEWSLSRGEDPEAILRVTGATWPFWIVRGHEGEARGWVQRLLAESRLPIQTRIQAINWAAYLALVSDDPLSAQTLAEESASLSPGFPDDASRAFLLRSHGLAAYNQGDTSKAIDLMETSVDLYAKVDDPPGHYIAMYWLAEILWAAGDLDRAEDLHERALALKREHGDVWQISWSLFGLALLAWTRGDLERAEDLLQQSLSLRVEIGHLWGIALTMEALAWITLDVPHSVVRCARLLGAADELRTRLHVKIRANFQSTHDKCVNRARTVVGESAFFAECRTGQEMTLDEALAYAATPSRRLNVARSFGPDTLTQREWQVAQLIAEGLSNREIAARLRIADRTAECHVENIFSKLGVNSRTKVVAWVLKERSESTA